MYTKKFYLFNFIFWMFFGVFNLAVRGSLDQLDSLNLIATGIIVIFGFGGSSFFRYYFNKKLVELTRTKRIMIVAVAHIIIVSFQTIFGVGFIQFFLYINHQPMKWNISLYFINYINLFLVQSIWLGGYFSVKNYFLIHTEKLKKAEIESSLHKAQLDVLHGQINPHFMFNALNNIRSLMLIDVDKSRDMITSLADLLRYSLITQKKERIELREELEMVGNFIALEKLQLDDRLINNFKIDDSLYDCKIPPMSIQILVENSIKHGISRIKEKSELIIEIFNQGEYLNISVVNPIAVDSKKYDPIPSTYIGLKNLKERLNLIYGSKSLLTFEIEHQTAKAYIKIPLER